MPTYEHIFMARQDVSSQQVELLTDQYKAVIEEGGGAIEKVEQWGLKTLAYRIKKNRKAHYTLLNINAPHVAIAEMERQMNLNEDILRFMRISDFVLDSRIGALDRTLGFVYGAGRGLLLLVVAMLFLNWFLDEEQQPQWITTAKSRPVLVSLGDQLRNVLPEDADSWLIDTIKNKIRGGGDGDQAASKPVPDNNVTPAKYDQTDRGNLDQLVQSSNAQ